jgi:hypothetical protein
MKTSIVLVSLALLLATILASPAAAQVGLFGSRAAADITYLTFSGPVQVPGAVLPAGTYTFRRIVPGVILVTGRNERTVYAMFMTIPRERATVAHKDEMIFDETAATCCAPAAARVWFPAHRRLGYEFVYPTATPVTHVALR